MALIHRIEPTAAPAPVHDVRAQQTAVSPADIRAALARAHQAQLGKPASPALLDVLTAHVSLETGRGSRMFNINFGGIKGAGPSGSSAHYLTREVGPDHQDRHLVDGFRAYGSLAEGAGDYLRFVRTKYSTAFDAAGRGDVDGFAGGLKSRGYFTESVEPYAAALRSLAHADWSGSQLTSASHLHLGSVDPLTAPPDAGSSLPTTETVARVLDAVASMTARLGAPLEPPEP
jgi:hypothetical protein